MGDLHKVWEIKALKRKPRGDEAQKILERIAKQVQPIMMKHKWRVKLLSEFCPKDAYLLGMNYNFGASVKLRLRWANKDDEFIPFDQILDTMLHELCHNVHSPHNASFYNLWDELRKESEDLIRKGISGSSQGFDLQGRRLGGFPRQPPLSSLRKTALAAAEKRVRLGSLLSSGPKRLGGNTSIMASLSPIQAAAMAAERRLMDNVWCGSETWDESEERGKENDVDQSLEALHGSRKSGHVFGSNARAPSQSPQKRRRREPSEVPSSSTYNGQRSDFVDLTSSPKYISPLRHGAASTKSIYQGDDPFHASSLNGYSNSNFINLSDETLNSGVGFSNEGSHINEEHALWECETCTLLNPMSAPICEICFTQKPEDSNGQKLWTCKFCTLDNSIAVERCTACGEWKYSYGPPVASVAPNIGT